MILAGRELSRETEDIMAAEIGRDDYKLKYVSLAEAKNMSGLRLILGAHTIPGPWREACKSLFYVKKVPYTPVASAGQDGTDRELREWTAQNSASGPITGGWRAGHARGGIAGEATIRSASR